MSNIQIKIMMLFILVASFNSFSAPPEEPFNDLFIEGAYDGYPEAKIYANGRMQAEVSVFYKLKKGYEFIGAKLKRLYSKDDIKDVTESYNGYIKDIRFSSHKVYNTKFNSATNRVLFYLSSNEPGVDRVCVEARVRNIKTDKIIVKDTCSNETNKASISVEKITRINYSSDDFKLIYESEVDNANFLDDHPDSFRISAFKLIGSDIYSMWDERTSNDYYARGYSYLNHDYVEAYKILASCGRCDQKFGFSRVWMRPGDDEIFYEPFELEGYNASGKFAYPTYYKAQNKLITSNIINYHWLPSRYDSSKNIVFLEAWNSTVSKNDITSYLAPAFGKRDIVPSNHYFYISDVYGHHIKVSTKSLNDGVIRDSGLIVENI